ncbi:MAG: hemin transporter HemP [Geobacteraceae bacterium GWC2_58_44]|nr:MAG: hemin transporter HemP [Geobacteraceae bacterium GWC2_58_44]
MATHRQPAENGPTQGPEKRRTRRSITSLELMGDGSELIIEHAGEEYRLSITRQAKLILTK